MLKTHNFVGSLILAFSITGCGGGDDDNSGSSIGYIANVTCASFSTQSQAQSYFNSQSNGSKLDADKDGKACEHLPKGLALIDNSTDISHFIGDYTLLGSNCAGGDCTAQLVTLSIDSENTMALCFQQDLESNCDLERRKTYQLFGQQDKVVFFKYGQIELDTINNGHLNLHFNDAWFYGQNILATDTSLAGTYNNNGILLNDDNGYSLTSYSGRVIQWDKQNQITLEFTETRDLQN